MLQAAPDRINAIRVFLSLVTTARALQSNLEDFQKAPSGDETVANGAAEAQQKNLTLLICVKVANAL